MLPHPSEPLGDALEDRAHQVAAGDMHLNDLVRLQLEFGVERANTVWLRADYLHDSGSERGAV